MTPNALKAAVCDGITVLGTMIGRLNSPELIPLLAQMPVDFVVIDTEHHPQNPETVYDLIVAGRRCGVTPLVRPPGHQYEYLCRPLDWGARGLMVPRVDTPEQVEGIVRCVQYPPQGLRGASLLQAALDFAPPPAAGEELLATLNDELFLICMVESQECLDNLEQMAQVPGLDAMIIGPFDLTTNLGISGQMDHPRLAAAIKRVADVCRSHGIAAGIHTSSEKGVAQAAEAGMNCLMFSMPERMLAAGGGDQVRRIRQRLNDMGLKTTTSQ